MNIPAVLSRECSTGNGGARRFQAVPSGGFHWKRGVSVSIGRVENEIYARVAEPRHEETLLDGTGKL